MMTATVHYCEWCGDQHGEDAHTVLTNLHMHMRTMPELVDDALAEAEAYRDRDGRASEGWADVSTVARVMTTPSQRLDGLREEWLTLTDDERDECASEFLDGVEDVLNTTGRYVAISDGGNTGDWLVLAVVPDDETE